jgi:hypothetical protein
MKWLAGAAAAAVLVSGSVALASGGSGSGSGSGGGGGGGSTQVIPQVAGSWRGAERYDASLAIWNLPDAPISFLLIEDAAGNITGFDTRMNIPITGKASSNGSIIIQDGAYYGQKITVNITGTVACSDGSTGQVMSGKFQRKEGFGTISLDNCPVL